MRNLINTLRNPENPDHEEEIIAILLDNIKCVKSIVNTWVSSSISFFQIFDLIQFFWYIHS